MSSFRKSSVRYVSSINTDEVEIDWTHALKNRVAPKIINSLALESAIAEISPKGCEPMVCDGVE